MKIASKNILIIALSILFLILIFFIPQPQRLFDNLLNRSSVEKSTPHANHEGHSDHEDADLKKASSTQLAVKSTNGRTIELESLKGKVVFLNFWATWCGPCISEMPSINNLHSKLKKNKDLVFLMVDVDGAISNSAKFMAKKNYSLPVFVPVGEIGAALFTESLPTTLIINKSGKVILKNEGEAKYDTKEMVDLISKLAAE
jgi:thiol-disulfide isomerase/thioredoxin